MQLRQPIRCIFQLAIISLLFLGIASPKADTLSAQVELTATPHMCLTDTQSQLCETDITLNWEMDSDELVCIISDYPDMPRWCSEDPNTQSLSLKIKSDKDIQFVLVQKNNNNTLAGVKVKVTTASSTKVRRRYRNPWSFF
ncbi:DUF3019 domain-containing protein [Shewanella sp. WXL01]|uniref:DUF3019 domain-containing protein n=1 Tax=Shewanella maritima TaxID=2520507 RepID=A0A411PFS8_9GAMM|nr:MULTISPECIES: DUF3019 domain-containing protein [Shewanella]NKF49659.1 DUF3019 domain-containing protein [Shewanella sp. WXL01]QBF82252.1 DUF3019 domain-containing protein [Shewanella maritima]